MTLSGIVKRLRIYTGEEAYHENKPLYRAILEEARRLNIAGGTVFKGIEGYGAHTRMIRTTRFLELSSDLPVVIEFVEKQENLEKLDGFLRKTLTKGLVTIEDVKVLGYGAKSDGDNAAGGKGSAD